MRIAAVGALILTILTGCGSSEEEKPAGEALVGTFQLDPGHCDAKGATGSYFRMIQPGGTVEKGGYFLNPDSKCPDQSYSVAIAGTDRGLVTGTFQPGPDPAFNARGDALAGQITRPGTFTAIKFAISTQSVDPGTGEKLPAPEVRNDDGKLSGQLTAWTAAWNNLYFNQGSPKPDGTTEGLTSPVVGTYDEESGRFELSWSSTIEGGPFDRFSGNWHLEGTFVASK
ncbi:hypothetical protein ASD81_09745 [Nocardioides sp. Root614]|nr:hypothetical protein ASD81_09745 [Nocardioides sp. Root614]KRA92811.1 hypothetical protein ASD84_10010 [Nocardioides sp. Root682]